MLAYILALVVGLGSLGVYLAAFFFPEVHRKSDFAWSGVGLFYALVLWVCAGRITGGVLLGQTASVALLGWFGWQTLRLRRELTPIDQQTALPQGQALQDKLTNLPLPAGLSKVPELLTQLFSKAKDRTQTVVKRPNQPQPMVTVQSPKPETPPAATEMPTPQPSVADSAETAPSTAASMEEIVVKSKPVTEVPPEDQPEKVATVVVSESTPDKTTLAQEKLQAKVANSSIQQNLSKLPEQATGLFNTVKNQVQGLLGKVTQRKSKPVIVMRPKAPVATKPAAVDEALDFEDEIEARITSEAAALPIEEEDKLLNNETEAPPAIANFDQAAPPVTETSSPVETSPLGSDVATESFIEEVAPEIAIAPPAEEVSARAEDRPTVVITSDTTEGDSVSVTETISSEVASSLPPESAVVEQESASSEEDDHPKLVPPNPPSPELREAAQRSADTTAQESPEEESPENP